MKKNSFKYLIIVFFIISFIIGFIGSYQYFSNNEFKELNNFNKIWASLYLTLQLYTLQANFKEDIITVLLNFSRFICPLILVSAILNLILVITQRMCPYC